MATGYLALGHISNPLLYAAVWLVIPTNTLGGLAAFPPRSANHAVGCEAHQAAARFRRCAGAAAAASSQAVQLLLLHGAAVDARDGR